MAAARDQARARYEQLEPVRQEPILEADRRGEEQIRSLRQGADEATVADIGTAAAEVAPKVVSRLRHQESSARGQLDQVMRSKDQAGVRLPFDKTEQALRQFVGEQAKSETRGAAMQSTGQGLLVDEAGRPIGSAVSGPPGSVQKFTPEGESIDKIVGTIRGFMAHDGTVGDWVKAIRWLESQERGQPATARLYRQLASIVRYGHHQEGQPTGFGGLANEDPEIGQAWAGYRAAKERIERATQTLTGKTPDKLGTQSAHARVDVPLPGDPYNAESLMPAEQDALRLRLMRQGEKTAEAAARAPSINALYGDEMGFAPELSEMDYRTAAAKAGRQRMETMYDDRRAAHKADIARQTEAMRRELHDETQHPVAQEEEFVNQRVAETREQARQRVLAEQATQRQRVLAERDRGRGAVEAQEAEAQRLMAAKQAQEASRWPRVSQIAEPGALMAMGLPRSSAHAAVGKTRLLAQPLASRIALRPPMDGPPVALPGLLGMTLQLNEKRNSTDQADDLVGAARAHAQRFGATIGERLGYQGAR